MLTKSIPSKLVEAAKAVALSGPGTGRRNSFRVGAVLFDNRGRVLAAKHNSYKTHPFLSSFTKWPFQHAESACLLAHGLDYCSEASLLVVRYHLDSRTLSCAKPCEVCAKLINMAGIQKVYFSNWKGEIECSKLEIA